MKDSKPALILYFASSLLYLLSILINNEQLTLIVKPMISSSMIFYYWQESRSRVNFWYVVILICFFISGILNLFEDEFALQYVIIVNLLSYTILIFITIQSIIKIKFKHMDSINFIYIIFIFLFLACFFYVTLFLVFDSTFRLYKSITIYAFTLLLLGVLNATLYSLSNSKSSSYLMITVFCYVICDLFYIIYYYYYDFIFLRYTSIICNVISFYFLVHYFIYKKQETLIGN
jgi:hypothetical protein